MIIKFRDADRFATTASNDHNNSAFIPENNLMEVDNNLPNAPHEADIYVIVDI